MKTPSSKEVTDDGIEICLRDGQLLKVEYPIDANEEGFWNVTCLSDLQPLNAESFIEITEEGIVIWVSEEQS